MYIYVTIFKSSVGIYLCKKQLFHINMAKNQLFIKQNISLLIYIYIYIYIYTHIKYLKYAQQSKSYLSNQ